VITTDFLIIGGGIIGINIARQLKASYADASIILLEKEQQCGMHASGRNSGVLHAGFYYTPDSLKAKYTQRGNELLSEYCAEKNIRVNRCGKLVVAKDEGDHASLDELLHRGRSNGVPLEALSENEAKAIEPRVKTCRRALYSPTTASVDPVEVMQAMAQDAMAEGIAIHAGVAYRERCGEIVKTSRDSYQAGYVVNAAGLYADRVARDFGFSEHYRILPFKGLYLYSEEPPYSLKTNIYPVPDLRNPFLGVHYTVTVDGGCKIGPTAIPALWREQYSGFDNFHFGEFAEILLRQAGLLGASSFSFKRLALEELAKYSRARMVAEAGTMVTGVAPEHYLHWGRPGIRAQLLDLRSKSLEMDFVLEGDHHSLHILNAVSPAFTCAIPFAQHVCSEVRKLIH